MTYQIAISIINYKTGDLTLQCVQSVLDDFDGIDGRIIVVDNFSDDGSADQIADWIAQRPDAPIELVRSPTNTGFSGGHNLGIEACAADFYLLLNSDAILRPGFCKSILAAAEAHPKAGLLAPRIEYDDGEVQTSCFRIPSAGSELVRSANTGFVTKAFKRYEVAIAAPPPADQIEWASFACILLRDEMVEKLGPMDEGYFLYFEDTEYCLRARRAGWGVVHTPEAIAVHYRGGSGPTKTLIKERKRLPAYYYASRTRLLYQAHGRAGLLAANLAWYLGRGIAQLRRFAGKSIYPMPKSEAVGLWTNFTTPLGPRHAPGEET